MDLDQDAAFIPLLEADRGWAAYALCDLEPPYRVDARYIGATRDGQVVAILVIYAPPSFVSLVPCGDVGAMGAILEVTPDLPRAAVLLAQRRMLPAIERRYVLGQSWTMLRMVVTPERLHLTPPVGATVARLVPADLPALLELYARHPGSVFTPFMFEHGVYFGAVQDGMLVAVAGTHAVSPRYRIGVIGNVFTQPEYRGRGLATAVTGAVAGALFASGAQLVALNVREDNAPAVRAYARIGFSVHEAFWEGAVALRA